MAARAGNLRHAVCGSGHADGTRTDQVLYGDAEYPCSGGVGIADVAIGSLHQEYAFGQLIEDRTKRARRP